MRQLNLIEVTNAAVTANLVAKQDRRTVAGYLANQPVPPANLSQWQPTLPRHGNEPPMGCLLDASSLRAGRLAAVSGSFAGSSFRRLAASGSMEITATLDIAISKHSKRYSKVNGTVVIHSTDRHRLTVDHDYRSHDHRDDLGLASRERTTTLTRMTTATTTVGK